MTTKKLIRMVVPCLMAAMLTGGCKLASSFKIGGVGGSSQPTGGGGSDGGGGGGTASPGEDSSSLLPSIGRGAGGKPGWCAKRDGGTETEHMMIKSNVDAEGWRSDKTARSIAFGACVARHDPAETAKAAATVREARAGFMKASGLTEGEMDAYFAVVTGDYFAAEAAYCDPLKPDPEEATAHELARVNDTRMLFCKAGYGAALPSHDWPDRTEREKVAQVIRCFRHLEDQVESQPRDAKKAASVVQYASCSVLARSLDPKRYAAELATDPGANTVYIKSWAKMRWTEATQLVAKVRPFYDALAAKDDVLRTVIVDAPRKAHAAWTKMYAADKAAYDLARFVVDNHKVRAHRKVMAGCQTKLWPVVAKRFKARKPSTPAEAKGVLLEPLTLLAATAATICEMQNKNEFVASFYWDAIGDFTSVAPGLDAAVSLGVVAEMAAHADEIPGADRVGSSFSSGFRFGNRWAIMSKSEVEAIIKAVSPKGRDAQVTFKTEKWKQDTWNCRETNKVDAIGEGGKLVYRQDCAFAGQVTRSSTTEPVTALAGYTGGLAPGRRVTFVTSASGAIPKEIWDGKKLVGYRGFTW